MAKAAGVITLRMKAGTAELFTDMDRAKAKVLEFGGSTKSSMAASSAALRELEGNFANNNRAIARFLATTVGLGPVLQAAFPIIGGLAFGTMIVELGGKVAQFFKDMQQAPQKVAGALRDLNAPLKLTNDDLAVTNARLENDIAKLEGKRENALKVALLEAKEAADKLADSLDKDLAALNKILAENSISGLKAFFTGQGATKGLERELGGETGLGGFAGRIRGMLAGGAKPADIQAAYQAEIEKLRSQFLQPALYETGKYLARSGGSEKLVPEEYRAGFRAAMGGEGGGADERVLIEKAKGAIQSLQEQMGFIGLETQRGALSGKKSGLEAAQANSELTKPFTDRIAALEAGVEAARGKLGQTGLGPEAKALGDAYAEAVKAIADVNKELEKHHTALTEDQEAQIKSLAGTAALLNAETQWQDRLAQTATQIRDRVKSQEMLTAAIGRGAEAEMKARVETQVMGAMGERYGKQKYASDEAQLRAGFLSEAQAQRAAGSAEAVYSLQQEIRAQDLLTAAQAQGEEEIRRLGAMAIWRAGIEKELTGQQIGAEIQLYYAKQRTHDAAEIAKLNAATTATEKLAAAQLQGAEAARKQTLENQYAEMERTGRGAAVPAERMRDEAAHQSEVTRQVASRVNVYSDEIEKLDQERDRLLAIIGEHKATVDQARALRDLQNERLALWVREQLAIGTARAGVRAFFADMQANAKRPGEIFYESMHSAVDRASDELAKLFTGQKTDFGKMLQGLGQDMLRSSIKSGLEKGLGALGKLFGIKGPESKPDGTSAKPFHVIVDNQGQAPGTEQPGSGAAAGVPAAAASAIPWLGNLLKRSGGDFFGILKAIFGGSGGGSGLTESVTSTFTPMASGGEVAAGGAYLVGERGPEPFFPGVNGTILNHALAQRVFGGGGNSGGIFVDARGAELGSEQRMYRAAEHMQRAAVATSVQAVHERARRVPQRA